MSNFALPVIKTLFALSGNTCAYRGCEKALTDPAWDEVNADIAHIRSPKPNGPRHDPEYIHDVDDFPNLILLCPGCHRRIDRLEPDKHPVELLEEMKAEHESRSLDAKEWADEDALRRFAVMAINAAIIGIGRTVPDPGAAPPPRVLSDHAGTSDSVSRGVVYSRGVVENAGSTDMVSDGVVRRGTSDSAGGRDSMGPRPVPRLALRLADGSGLDVQNIGSADAFGVQVLPLSGRSAIDPAVIPPPRISPGETWRAGYLKHTDGPPVTATVRVQWRDESGSTVADDFQFEAGG